MFAQGRRCEKTEYVRRTAMRHFADDGRAESRKERVVIQRNATEGRGIHQMMARHAKNAMIAIFATTAVAASLGCEADGWLYDPSIVGRWEHTPTTVPILERIDVIERDRGDFIETTEVMPEDLVPEVREYEVGAGDTIVLEIFDFLQPNTPSQFQRQVDARGAIDLPQIGRVDVLGLTGEEIRQRLQDILRDRGIMEDALISIQITGQRRRTFSIFGAVAATGRYFIPDPNYRLLEALTEAGGLSPSIQKIFIIRQVPLSDDAQRGEGVQPAEKPAPREQDTEEGVELLDLIDELTEPGEEGGSGSGLGAISRSSDGLVYRAQDQDGASGDGQPPAIELVDEPESQAPAPREDETQAAQPARWMFLNGEWVRVTQRQRDAEGLPEGEAPLDTVSPGDLMTQRVIEIPAKPLLQGAAEYNVVIRPGDVVRVPSPEQGNVYIGGPGIARPGTYTLPAFGRLTLSKAVISAGGLSPVAVPWKVDLTRMVGDSSQATIRLNLKAIYAGTQPDLFLKPDDVVNLGTDFWAQPLAIIRNGFRMSYGFGFLLDRNFGNDVFGAPPTNRLGF